MKIYSCPMIVNQYLNFNGRIDTGQKVMSLCCEALPVKSAQKPAISLEGDPEDVLERFLEMRNIMLASSLKEGDKAKTVTKDAWLGCRHCANYQKADWQPQLQVTYVNLSMYPAPCQCKCIYCGAYRQWENTDAVKESYEKMFQILELADQGGS